ncbi:putative secreted protein [Jannaschia seosinensis]|uniref:Putative secreted protein n=1 Tax=Jannaschia seosinensis TaxID=313367 RepID=A0A0M7BEM3_9RHOB|nr:DUF1223 domain-containing protein [Jannaschia seosinensis]CUH40528.1 putative secreted protein [Jannaschia seosinensis]
MRSALTSLLFACAALPAAADPVVVELFTAQGCSSCPPADALLSEIAADEDVIALSLHVDYWDWIGWRDTFAKPAFTERQYAYAAGDGTSVVYTPQFVVGGSDVIAGPSGIELAKVLDAHGSVTDDVLRIASSPEGREVMAMPMKNVEAAELVLVTYLPQAQVRVLHGENAGRVMDYHNIVHGWDVLAPWSGANVTVPLPDAPKGMRQVVLAQSLEDGRPGAILGAVRAD